MDPNEVSSPKKRLRELEVLYNNGIFAIASMKWDGSNRIGIRWNGEDDSKGYPHSHAHATWFIIPKEVAHAYAKFLNDAEMESVVMASDDASFV